MGTKLGRDKYLARKEAKEKEAQKVLENNEAKAEKSMYNIRRYSLDIFIFAQCLIDRIDSLKEDDCNYSQLKLGNNHHLIRHELKAACNKFTQQLTKTIDRESTLFDEEYLEYQSEIVSMFETLANTFTVRNVERIQAVTNVLVSNDPQPLIDYYKSLEDEKITT